MNFKGIVHPNLSSFTSPHVVPKPHDEFLSLKTPKRNLKEDILSNV